MQTFQHMPCKLPLDIPRFLKCVSFWLLPCNELLFLLLVCPLYTEFRLIHHPFFPYIFKSVFQKPISVCSVLSWNFGMMVGLTLEIYWALRGGLALIDVAGPHPVFLLDWSFSLLLLFMTFYVSFLQNCSKVYIFLSPFFSLLSLFPPGIIFLYSSDKNRRFSYV